MNASRLFSSLRLRRQLVRVASFLALASALAVSSFGQSTLTVNLTQTSEAFKNPLKGFRPSYYIGGSGFPVWSGNEYVSTFKQYIPYTDLEQSTSDTAQKIIDWSNANWSGLPAANEKVVPRVVIDYPGTGEYWATGIPQTDGGNNTGGDQVDEWTSSQLQARAVALIAKLGQAWDNDPRVAAVELGIWGYWGEHNIYPNEISGNTTNVLSADRIPAAFQQALGDAAVAAFKNKKVMIRYPETFPSYNFGEYWDSFALPDDAAGGNGEIAKGNWQNAYETGEVAYNWGDQSNLGGSPNANLESTNDTNYVIGWIQKCHTSSLGWIAEYDNTQSGVEANATAMQKAFGYRFVIGSATFPTQVASGGTMTVSFSVNNVANAPFYYQWPVQATLLTSGKTVAWSGLFNVDIRTWVPGGPYNVSGSFTLPGSLANGTYTLAFAILDPAGNLPAVRFANTNYYNGGWTPVGKVGVGQAPSDQNLGSFDGLKADNSLYYTMTTSTSAPSAPTGLAASAGNGQVNLSWTASSGAMSYLVLRSTTSGSGYSQIASVSASGTSYADTAVSNGTTYYYVVEASNSGGTSGASNQVSATPAATAPAAPTNLSATAGNAQVSLSWTASSGATGYTALRSTTSGSGYSQIATNVASNNYVDSTAANGTAYYYVVDAFNSGGTSGNSNQASATPSASSSVTVLAASSANTLAGGATVSSVSGVPGGQVVGYIGEGGTLTFNLSGMSAGTYTMVIAYIDGDSGRTLDVSVNGGSASAYSLTGTGSWSTLGSYTVTGLALNAGSDTIEFSNPSGWAPDINGITLTGGSLSAPSAPTSLSATGSSGLVALTWTASSGATGYNVRRSTTSGSGYATIGTPTTASYNDTSVTNGTTYYYVVQASNSAGTSGNSNQASATPAASVSAPATPTNFTATAGNASVSLAWTASSGATSYLLYRSTTSGSGYTQIAGVTTPPQYTDNTVTNGVTYYYEIVASNSAGASAAATASATPTGGSSQIVTIDSFSSSTAFSNHLNDLNQSTSWAMQSIYYGSDSVGNLVMDTANTGDYLQENVNRNLSGATNLVLSMRDWWASDTMNHWAIDINDGTDHIVSPLNSYGNITASYANYYIPLSAFGANLANVKFIKFIHIDSTYATLLIDSISVQ